MFLFLREKIAKRINGWAHRHLYFGGRLTLIKSTLEAIPLHTFQAIEPTGEASNLNNNLLGFFGERQTREGRHIGLGGSKYVGWWQKEGSECAVLRKSFGPSTSSFGGASESKNPYGPCILQESFPTFPHRLRTKQPGVEEIIEIVGIHTSTYPVGAWGREYPVLG